MFHLQDETLSPCNLSCWANFDDSQGMETQTFVLFCSLVLKRCQAFLVKYKIIHSQFRPIFFMVSKLHDERDSEFCEHHSGCQRQKSQEVPGFRSLRICADLQDFCRSLQICADSKKNDLLRNTIETHSNVKRIIKLFKTREKSHLCQNDETFFCINLYRSVEFCRSLQIFTDPNNDQ